MILKNFATVAKLFSLLNAAATDKYVTLKLIDRILREISDLFAKEVFFYTPSAYWWNEEIFELRTGIVGTLRVSIDDCNRNWSVCFGRSSSEERRNLRRTIWRLKSHFWRKLLEADL